MANLAAVLKELEQERSRLDQAIQVIGGLVGRNGAGGSRKGNRVKRTLSIAARRKIAAGQSSGTNQRQRTGCGSPESELDILKSG